MEFKQKETKSALSLLKELGDAREKANNMGDRWSIQSLETDITDEYRDEREIWSISEYMMVQIYTDAIDKITKDIETQSFDY